MDGALLPLSEEDFPEWLEEIAQSKGIPKSALRIIKANREDVPKLAAVSNWSVFFIKPVYSKKASSPTKMGELLGLGIPLICNSNVGDVEAIMNTCSQGQLVHHYTIEEYSKIADSILTTTPIQKDLLNKTAWDFYSLEMGVKRYASVYENLIGEN